MPDVGRNLARRQLHWQLISLQWTRTHHSKQRALYVGLLEQERNLQHKAIVDSRLRHSLEAASLLVFKRQKERAMRLFKLRCNFHKP